MLFWKILSSISVFINALLLVYVFLRHEIINFWRFHHPKELSLKIGETYYKLRCYELQIKVLMSYRYHTLTGGKYQIYRHTNRLHIESIVFPEDIDKILYESFSSESTVRFIDTKEREFEVLIGHLSRVGKKSYLNLMGQKALEQGIAPEGSIFSVQRISDETFLREAVEKGLADIDLNGWDKIYDEKIKPAEKRWNECIYDPDRRK